MNGPQQQSCGRCDGTKLFVNRLTDGLVLYVCARCGGFIIPPGYRLSIELLPNLGS